MTPTIRSSDGKARLGHITKQGSRPLRWALVEAAQHAGRGGGPLRDSFERIAKRRGRKIAKVAVARKILTLSYYGLRDGEIRCLARRCRPSGEVVSNARRLCRRSGFGPARSRPTSRLRARLGPANAGPVASG